MKSDALDADMRIFVPRSERAGEHPSTCVCENGISNGEEQLLLWLPAKARRGLLG